MYCASALYTDKRVITEVRKIISNFIWDGGTPKIKYDVLIQDVSKGGLGLIDIEGKINAINLCWVPKLCYGTGNWKAGPEIFYDTENLEFFHYRDPKTKNNHSKFYKKIFTLWLNCRKDPKTKS